MRQRRGSLSLPEGIGDPLAAVFYLLRALGAIFGSPRVQVSNYIAHSGGGAARGSCGQDGRRARRTLPFSRTWEEKEKWEETRVGNLSETTTARLPVVVSLAVFS